MCDLFKDILSGLAYIILNRRLIIWEVYWDLLLTLFESLSYNFLYGAEQYHEEVVIPIKIPAIIPSIKCHGL
jgi:hypothetical protein